MTHRSSTSPTFFATLALRHDAALAFLAHDGRLEVALACGWDHAAKRITYARVICRGTSGMVRPLVADFRRGELFLHNHPGGNIEPSEQDLATAALLARGGVGLAVTDNFCSRLMLVREPALPDPPAPPRALEQPQFHVRALPSTHPGAHLDLHLIETGRRCA